MSNSTAEIIDRAQGKTAVGYQAPRPQGTGTPFKAEWTVNCFLVCDSSDENFPIFEIPEAEFFGKDHVGKVVMQISKSNHRDFPGHRFTLGAILPDGRFVPNISPRVSDQRQGTPVIDEKPWRAAFYLFVKAETWQQTDVAIQCDRYVDRSATPRGTTTEAPKRGIGKAGKTERERAKGKARPKAV
jgi:hypothetical protein